MYAFISGTVVSVSDGEIVIENNGIGYRLSVSATTLAEAGSVGKRLQLWTYLCVKEDAFTLFGFSSREEKEMFLRLIGISGIGPKLAQQVLSGCDPKTLALCIATGDAKTLARVKGLGKKTAERIILELREKVGEMDLVGQAVATESGGDSDMVNDAVLALSSLGFARVDALRAVREVVNQADRIDELIALALRKL